MRIANTIAIGLCSFAGAVGAAPAQAEVLTFPAKLDGSYGTAPTGSTATGDATVEIDTVRRTVSLDMTVNGIAPDALWDRLVAAPIGPVHLHKYATAAGGNSVLVVPFPYGATYKATANGLRVTVKGYDYATGAALLKSTLSFDDFVAAVKGGLIVLNVHTDAHNPGEISGLVGGGKGPAYSGAPHKH